MPEGITGGLYLMALGMGIVFGALIIIMLVMIALERLFREGGEDGNGVAQASAASEAQGGDVDPPAAAVAESATEQSTAAGTKAEIAVVLAVAIARARAAAYAGTGAQVPGVLDNAEDDRWDWVWDEGVDDYGTTRGSQYATI